MTGLRSKIGSSLICFSNTVLDTTAVVVCTSSVPASTVTVSVTAPTSNWIGGMEYCVPALSLIPVLAAVMKPEALTSTV